MASARQAFVPARDNLTSTSMISVILGEGVQIGKGRERFVVHNHLKQWIIFMTALKQHAPACGSHALVL